MRSARASGGELSRRGSSAKAHCLRLGFCWSALYDARGDADGGRRGRANSALPYNGKTNGVGRRTHAAEDTSELSAPASAPAV